MAAAGIFNFPTLQTPNHRSGKGGINTKNLHPGIKFWWKKYKFQVNRERSYVHGLNGSIFLKCQPFLIWSVESMLAQ